MLKEYYTRDFHEGLNFDYRTFFLLSTVAHISMFPLLFRTEEFLVKVFLTLFHVRLVSPMHSLPFLLYSVTEIISFSVCLYANSSDEVCTGSAKKARLKKKEEG